MLPILIQRLGFRSCGELDPFIASLVDVVGLLIYLTVAQLILL